MDREDILDVDRKAPEALASRREDGVADGRRDAGASRRTRILRSAILGRDPASSQHCS
jgi:hypothetical protein